MIIRLLISSIIALVLSACSTVATQQHEKAAGINVQLGISYLNEGKLELANAKLERALKEDPDSALGHWSYALLQQRLGNNASAEEHFRKAVDLDPKDSMAHNNYGIFLCEQGRLKEADQQFQQAVKNPLYAYPESAYSNAGMCAQKGANVEAAETYYRQALKKNPRYAPALFQMTKLSFERGHYLQSRAFAQRYEQSARPSPESVWLSYQIEQKLGNRLEAESYADKLKTKFPDSKHTAQLLDLERNARYTGHR